MKSSATLLTMVMMTMLLADCAGGTTAGKQIESYPTQTGDNAIVVSWGCSPAQSNVLLVKGAVTDITTAPIQDVTIQVVGIGADGGQISSGKGFTEAIVLTPTYTSRFEVAVNTTGTEKQFKLYYSYRVGATTYASPQQTAATNACPGLPR